MKKLLVILLLLCGAIVSSFTKTKVVQDNYIPNSGYVPDKETAIKIAEAVWLPIYGKSIYSKRPFKATLKNSEVWIVEGCLPQPMNGRSVKGGVPYIEIQKSDCKVLKVIHGK